MAITYQERECGQSQAWTAASMPFGWSFTDYGPDYSSFEDGRITGGLRKEESNSTGGVLIVVYAIDLESVQKSVTNAGSKITREIFSFPGGKRFHFLDPGNNELAVWSEQYTPA